MRTRYCAWIDGKGLHDIDQSIMILDIVEQGPDAEAVTIGRSAGRGTYFDRMNRYSLSVQIVFMVYERDTERRARILNEVRRWAQTGYLTTNDRPGKRLYVTCDRLPSFSALRWTEPLEISLTAYDLPWWEEEMPTRCEISTLKLDDGRFSGSSQLFNPGTELAPIECTIVPASKTDMIRIGRGGDNYIQFENLGAKAGSQLTISHDKRGLLRLMLDGNSVMDKRTGKSQDEVLIDPGWNTVIVLSPVKCSATCTVRGRWL